MRVVFLGQACHLVELDDLRILTDPWLVDPIFEGRVEHTPPLRFGVPDLPRIDVVALTHAHLDHFNAPSLSALPDKTIPVVHPPIRFTELDTNLHRLGFSNLQARRDYEPFTRGSVRIVPTPALGVLDECAYLIEGRNGRFWNGADAPQPPEVIQEIADRFGPVDLAACSHNSFDQPALLGLASFKPADHGPEAAVRTAAILRATAVQPAASSMRWRGADGDAVTHKVIRRSADDCRARLAADGRAVGLDLQPGDAWSRDGVERSVIQGAPAPRVAHDYLHAWLGTGERWCPEGRPTTEDTMRRDLPARLRATPAAAQYVGQSVCIEIVGDDPGTWTAEFRSPGSVPTPGDSDAPFALRLVDRDWKDLFERRLSWQVLLVSDRLRVTRLRPGLPPEGLHFAYAMQAVFP